MSDDAKKERTKQSRASPEVENIMRLGTDAERFTALAAMTRVQYDRVREHIAKLMSIRVTTLDAEVEKLRHPEPPPQANGHDTSAQMMPSEIVEAMNERHALIWQSGDLRVLWRHEWDGGAPRTSSVTSTRLYYRNQEVRKRSRLAGVARVANNKSKALPTQRPKWPLQQRCP